MGKNSNPVLFVSSKKGIFVCIREGGKWSVREQVLSNHHLTCVSSQSGGILAGSRDGIVSSPDGGKSWEDSHRGLRVRHIRSIVHQSGVPGLVFAGTEPAAIFVSRDGGLTWDGRAEVEDLRDRLGWYLPYSPEAGCIRSFAFHGERLFAAAEIGGVLRSDDGGDTWYLIGEARGTVHPAGAGADDVHSVEIHPSSPDHVYATTGGGLFRSSDAGRSWDYLYDCYCRAVWVDPKDPAHLIFSPATRKGWHGSIARSLDGGKNWESASNGLDDPWPGKMIERFLLVAGEFLALRSDGLVFSASAGEWQWEHILPEVDQANGMAPMWQP
jgi:photosystem II stability/assembly factor-like uncharacterized protein